MTECNYHDCTENADLTRIHAESGSEYAYCAEHDPLEDEKAAFAFSEASDA